MPIRENRAVIAQSEMDVIPAKTRGTGKVAGRMVGSCSLGPGIQGNRVIGATDEGQFAVPLDPQTLHVNAENGIPVRPEYLQLALRDLAGISSHENSHYFPFTVPDVDQLPDLWT